MAKSAVREYAILYIGGKRVVGAGAAMGGNVLLNAGQHAIDGPEHTGHLLIDSLEDVDTVSTPPADGDVLTWVDADSLWEPLAPGAGSSDVPWSYAQADGGLAGDGTTDDTAAFQAWIDAVTASGTQSGWFFFEPGTYLIAGALQDTGAFNGQILLPSVSTSATQITLTFQGNARPPFAYHGPTPAPNGYSIIKSSLTGASGTAACISGGNGSYPGAQNNISVVVRDLQCVAPDNPTFTFWNLGSCQGGAIESLQITTSGALAGSYVQPTHSNSYGIKLPNVRNSNYTYVDGLSVGLWYTGVLQGELAICRGLIFGLCAVAIEFAGGSEHMSLIVDMHATDCTTVLKATGTHYCDILAYDFETTTGPGWADIVYDLDDASNYLHGHTRYFGYPNPPTHTFTKNGGTNFSAVPVGPLAGTSFATPAIALGTAAAAGAASTVIRSDSTIAAFDATVPTTQAFSDAAATGSAAFAARRDHVHGMPATPAIGGGASDHEHVENVVFSGDGSTTAWELPAAPVDSTGVSVFVGGSRSQDWTLSGAMLTTLTFGSAPASATDNIAIDIVAAVA